MRRITAYILSQVLTTMLFVVATLTMAIWLTQSLRFIELIVNRGLSLASFFYLTSLLLPNFLSLVLPIALFIATLFVYNRLAADSELVVMRAVGFGPGQLARPALLLACGVTIAGYVLSLWLMPLTFGKFKELHTNIRSDYSSLLLQEGAFSTIGNTLTVYVRARESNGDLRGIMVQDARDPNNPVTLLAERGTIASTEDGPRVILLNGNRQQVDRAAGKLSLLYFERYSVEISNDRTTEFRWRDAGERYLDELLWPNIADAHDRQYFNRLIAEGHTRLATPLYAIALVMVALACLLPGDFNRRGLGRRLLFASACGLATQALSVALPNLATGMPRILPLLYIAPIGVSLLAAFALQRGPGRIDLRGLLRPASAA
jgi:lipopolysaccharide export system permease protein